MTRWIKTPGKHGSKPAKASNSLRKRWPAILDGNVQKGPGLQNTFRKEEKMDKSQSKWDGKELLSKFSLENRVAIVTGGVAESERESL